MKDSKSKAEKIVEKYLKTKINLSCDVSGYMTYESALECAFVAIEFMNETKQENISNYNKDLPW